MTAEEYGGLVLLRSPDDRTLSEQAVSDMARVLGSEDGVVTVFPLYEPEQETQLWSRLGDVLDSLERQGTTVLRLALSGAGQDQPEAGSVGQQIADNWQMEVLAPDGELVLVPGGAFFVRGDRTAGGWRRFSPDQMSVRGGLRLPAPAWQTAFDQVPVRAPRGTLVERIPAGLLLRSPELESPGIEALCYSVPMDLRRPTVLVGMPEGDSIPPEDVVRVLASTPAAARSNGVRLAPWGPGDLLRTAQLVADTLETDVEVLTGTPLFAMDERAKWGSRSVMVDRGGRPTWIPFVDAVVCTPASQGRAAPKLLRWHPPLPGPVQAQRGVVRLSEAWQVTATRAGLWVDAAGTPRSSVSGPVVDAHRMSIEVGVPGAVLDDHLWLALAALLSHLGPETRKLSSLVVHGVPADGGRAVRELAASLGVPSLRFGAVPGPGAMGARRALELAPGASIAGGVSGAPAPWEQRGSRQGPVDTAGASSAESPSSGVLAGSVSGILVPATDGHSAGPTPGALAPSPPGSPPGAPPGGTSAPELDAVGPAPRPEADGLPPRPAAQVPAERRQTARDVLASLTQSTRFDDFDEVGELDVRSPVPPGTPSERTAASGALPERDLPDGSAEAMPASVADTGGSTRSAGAPVPLDEDPHSDAPHGPGAAPRGRATEHDIVQQSNVHGQFGGSGEPTEPGAPSEPNALNGLDGDANLSELRIPPSASTMVVGDSPSASEAAALRPSSGPQRDNGPHELEELRDPLREEPVPGPRRPVAEGPGNGLRDELGEGFGENSWEAPGEYQAEDPVEAVPDELLADLPDQTPPSPDAVEPPLPSVVPPVFPEIPLIGPGHRSTEDERARFHTYAEEVWDTYAPAVTRILSRTPGLRGHEQEAVHDDLLAVHLYLAGAEGPFGSREFHRALRAGEPQVLPYAACLSSGLRRLPSFRGVALRGPVGDSGPGEVPVPGAVLCDPAPLGGVVLASEAPMSTGTSYAIWSSTGRRLRQVRDSGSAPSQELLFAPGTWFRVLDVRSMRGAPLVCLRELPRPAAPVDGDGLDGQDRTALDAIAAAMRRPGAPATLSWPERCRGRLG